MRSRVIYMLICTICVLIGATCTDAQIFCFTTGGFGNSVRAEGLAEMGGDVGFFCQTSDVLSGPVTADIRLSLNTNVTNNRDFGKGADITDAVLIVNGNDCPLGVCEPQTTSTGFGQGTNPSPFTPLPQYGQLTSATTLLWSGVTLLPPSSGFFTSSSLRITNVRAKAFGLTGSSVTPPTILVSVFLSGSVPIMLSQFPISIGSTQPGLAASLSLGRVLESFRVNLQEGFPAAFKILGFPVVSSGGLAQEDG